LRHRAARHTVAGTGSLADNDNDKRGNAMNLRRCALHFALLIASLAMPAAASAQGWPARQISVIVPLGAGSASDIIARVVMEQVGRQVGQTVVVENRPGAGGTIGANMVAKAAPDGYAVLVYGALASAHALHDKLPYDTLNDLIPVASLGQQILVIISSPAKGYKTLGDLVAAAKAKPGALNYSSAGVGSASHIGAERLRTSVNFEAQHIPFKGAAEAVTDVIAERVDFSVQLPATTLPLLKDGKLVALAVSAQKRATMFPDVPTTIEAGLPPSSVYPFYTGVYLPAKTPPDVVAKLADEIAKALQADAVKARLASLGVDPMPMTPAEFAKFIKDDVEANVALVKAAKIPTQ
jgi:tripartite-type tricarboxylate transporter receptor subunit TctC